MGLKDRLVSTGVERAFNYYLADIGEISDFELNSRRKTIEFTILLYGETEPIKIQTYDYELLKDKEKQYFVIHNLSASRRWINTAFEKFLKDKKIEIPSKYEFIVRRTM